MSHDVFISYSHKDQKTADAICSSLERDGIGCWYAPRDIAPGDDWATTILDAIEAAGVMVVIFSEDANESEQVLREVSCAVSAKIPLLVYRLTKTRPNASLQYYLATVPTVSAGSDFEMMK